MDDTYGLIETCTLAVYDQCRKLCPLDDMVDRYWRRWERAIDWNTSEYTGEEATRLGDG